MMTGGPNSLRPRPVTLDDIMPLARLWHDSWHETHAPFVPNALIQLRNLRCFEDRLRNMGDLVRCVGPIGAPLGLCAIKTDVLHQLYVSPKGRGTGMAATLLENGERRLTAQGTITATLNCLPENKTAIRFYHRNGWTEAKVEFVQVHTSDGPFDLPCLIFRKDLIPHDT